MAVKIFFATSSTDFLKPEYSERRFTVVATRRQKDDPPFNPHQNYAICDGKIATINSKGERREYRYRSGEKLVGRLMNREDDML